MPTAIGPATRPVGMRIAIAAAAIAPASASHAQRPHWPSGPCGGHVGNDAVGVLVEPVRQSDDKHDGQRASAVAEACDTRIHEPQYAQPAQRHQQIRCDEALPQSPGQQTDARKHHRKAGPDNVAWLAVELIALAGRQGPPQRQVKGAVGRWPPLAYHAHQVNGRKGCNRQSQGPSRRREAAQLAEFGRLPGGGGDVVRLVGHRWGALGQDVLTRPCRQQQVQGLFTAASEIASEHIRTDLPTCVPRTTLRRRFTLDARHLNRYRRATTPLLAGSLA